MKKYKVREVLDLLKNDGWYIARTRGDHRQLKNDTKKGCVTLSGAMTDVIDQGTLNSIWKQAGWK